MLRIATRACLKTARNSLSCQQARLVPAISGAFLQHGVPSNHRTFATVPIIYIEPNGDEKEVEAEVGKHLLDIAHDHNIELEGACGGELACATCHLIFEQEMYDTLPEKDEEEDDMLDMAFELTDTSRLGCQICVRDDMAGMKVRIPDDGFN